MELSGKTPCTGIVISSMLRDVSVDGTRQMVSRRSNGFIIKLKGKTEYFFGEKKWLLKEGEILFVKKGSSYYIREITPGYSYVVNFDACSEPEEDMFRLPIPQSFEVATVSEKMYRYWRKERVYGALSCLYTILDKANGDTNSYLSLRDRQLLEPVEAYLSEHLTDPMLKVESLSSLCGISDAYLRRIFKRRYGVSPAGYVTKERMRLACSLLVEEEGITVGDVSCRVGYKDSLYFSRIFKKQTGASPTEYRRAHTDDLF